MTSDKDKPKPTPKPKAKPKPTPKPKAKPPDKTFVNDPKNIPKQNQDKPVDQGGKHQQRPAGRPPRRGEERR